jgi:hypothetical protein
MMISVETTPTKPSTVTASPVKLSVSGILSILQSEVDFLRQFVNTSSSIGRGGHQKLTATIVIPNSGSTVSITYNTHHDSYNGGNVEHQSVDERFGQRLFLNSTNVVWHRIKSDATDPVPLLKVS